MLKSGIRNGEKKQQRIGFPIVEEAFSYWPMEDIKNNEVQDMNGNRNISFTDTSPEKTAGIKGDAIKLRAALLSSQIRNLEGRIFSNPNLAFQNDISKCGGIIQALAGCITSPNYPRNYDNNLNCIWVLNFSASVNVTFSFLEFRTEDEYNCSFDNLAFYENISQNPIYGRFCGMKAKNFTYSGPSTSLFLRFKTDFNNVKKGFMLQFSANGKTDACSMYISPWSAYPPGQAPRGLAFLMWVKDLQVSSTGGYILNTASNHSQGISVYANMTSLVVTVQTTTKKWETVTSLPDSINWVHIAISWSSLSAPGLVLYINGTRTAEGLTGQESSEVYKGSLRSSLNVTVDELAMFESSLPDWKIFYYYLASTGIPVNTTYLLQEVDLSSGFSSIQDVNTTLNKVKYLLSIDQLSPGSVKNTINILQSLVTKLPEVRFEPSLAASTATEYFDVIDVLLNSSSIAVWKNVTDRMSTLSKMISSTDIFLLYLITHLDPEFQDNVVEVGNTAGFFTFDKSCENQTCPARSDYLSTACGCEQSSDCSKDCNDYTAVNIPPLVDLLHGFRFPKGGSDYITITGEFTQKRNVSVALLGTLYKNIQEAFGKISPSSTKIAQQNSKAFYLVSNVISAAVSPAKGHISAEIKVTPQLQNSSEGNITFHCAFLDFRYPDAVWSSDGCTLMQAAGRSVVCRCEHVTNFGILMQVVSFEISIENARALSAIAYIGCSISIISLLLNLTLIAAFGSHKDPKSHLNGNMSAAVLSAQVDLLVGDSFTGSQIPCKVAAIILHYLYLSAFCWMLCKGLYLNRSVEKLFRNDYRKVAYYYFIGWGTFPKKDVFFQ
ncbi:adhesion G-protein coupled receptor D1-like [Latimeria chalumnae]|uniref:adhesion G-protein coupled receptor D1-like n=1 Tax=Latimeria chalumnae TaxID=7897 RepID=UPI00313EA06B